MAVKHTQCAVDQRQFTMLVGERVTDETRVELKITETGQPKLPQNIGRTVKN